MEIEGRHCAFKPCFGRDFVNNHTIQDTARALLPRRMPQSVIPLRTPPTAGLTMTYIRNSIIQFSHPRLSKITYLHPRFHHYPNITQIFFPPPFQSPETKQLPHYTGKNVNQSSKLTTGNKNLIKQKMHHETHTNSSTRNKLHIQTIKNLEININSQKRKIKYLHPGPPPIIPHHQFKVQNFSLHIGEKDKKDIVLPNDKRRYFVQAQTIAAPYKITWQTSTIASLCCAIFFLLLSGELAVVQKFKLFLEKPSGWDHLPLKILFLAYAMLGVYMINHILYYLELFESRIICPSVLTVFGSWYMLLAKHIFIKALFEVKNCKCNSEKCTPIVLPSEEVEIEFSPLLLEETDSEMVSPVYTALCRILQRRPTIFLFASYITPLHLNQHLHQ